MDYLITQTMVEYLAHVHKQPFDGVLFKSVQRSGGANIVIFPQADGSFPVAYVEESFKLFSTTSIQYSHETVRVGSLEDGIWIDRESDEW